MRIQSSFGSGLLFFSLLRLVSSTDALDEPEGGNFCSEVTEEGYDAKTWARTINATYTAIDKFHPTTTQTWKANDINKLDKVNLVITHTYESQAEDVFTIIVRKNNHNSANIEHKAILVRLGYTPTEGKNNRNFKYFAITDLYGCNLHVAKGTPVKIRAFQWAYAVVYNEN